MSGSKAAASAAAAAATEQQMPPVQSLPQYSFVNTGVDGNVMLMTLPAGCFDYATLAAANPGLDIVASAMNNSFPTGSGGDFAATHHNVTIIDNNGVVVSTTGIVSGGGEQHSLMSSEMNAQALIQYLNDNPGVTLSTESFPSLSELTISGNLDNGAITIASGGGEPIAIQEQEVIIESEPMDGAAE